MPDNPDIAIPWPGWRAVRRLGRGAYGSVWEIERDVAGEPERCALKVVGVPPEGDWDGSLGLGYDEGALSRSYGEQADQVLREYQLMASLSHPNVVACRDVAKVPHAGDPGCDVYIRMELLTPLPRWLRGREPDPRDAARAGLDVARALEACEARGIVHRDIKPANIMVDGYGNFKLGDFGVARTMEGTRTATVAGTESFMAPEVERRERYNQTVDIYSLGLVMWWMLSGYRGPFMPAGVIAPGDVARAEARRLQGEPVPAPDGCPEGLARIVLRACAFRPEDRYQGAAELAGDLEAFLSGGRADGPESRPGQERGPRPGRRGPAGPGAPAAAGDEGGDSMWPDAGDETVGRQCQRGVVRDAPPAEAGPTLARPAERQPGAKAGHPGPPSGSDGGSHGPAAAVDGRRAGGRPERIAATPAEKASGPSGARPEPATGSSAGKGGAGLSRRGFVILGGAGVAAVAGALLLGRLSGGAGSSHGGTTGDNSGSTAGSTADSTADSTGSLKTSDGIASKGSSSTGSTSSESSSKVRYYGSTGKLVMSAFDFSVILPSGLSCTPYSDGVTLREGSSDMVIDAWVRPNSQGESLADLRAAAAAGHDLTTNAGKDDWFVVSYWDGDIGYYLREYVSDDTIAALEFYWPRSSADHCSQLIEDMSKTISDDN